LKIISKSIFVNQQIHCMKNGTHFNLNKNTLGKLDSNGTPYLSVRVVGSQEWITAAIDTGAFKSAVIPYFLSQVPLKQINTEYQIFVNNGLQEVGIYNLEFEIKGIDDFIFKEEVIGTPNTYTHQILIGTNFLSRCKEFNVFLDKGFFELKM
jgi:hypothetical protein